MRDKNKAAKFIAEQAVKKVGGKRVGNRWNMTPAVRRLEKQKAKDNKNER